MKRSIITPLAVLCVLAACSGSEDTSLATIAPVASPPDAGTTPVSPDTTAPTATQAPVGTEAPSNSGAIPADLPTSDCLLGMQEAVALGEPEDYPESYYPVFEACTGVADWLAAAEMTGFDPGIDPVEWASQVCALDGPMLVVTCQEAMGASPIE